MRMLPIDNRIEIITLGCPFDRILPKNFDFPGESHDFTEIVYIDSGKVEIVENEKVYILGRCDMIIHAPMEFHRIKSDAGTSPRVFNLSARLKGDIPKKLYEGVFTLTTAQRDEFIKVFKSTNIFSETGDSFLGQQSSAGLLSLLINIYLNNSITDSTAADPAAIAYRNIVKCMNNEVYSNLTLNEIAQKNNISISYIKLLFRTFANTCPKNYYSKLRANEAAKMILKGIPVNELSEMMNFSSPNYFCTYFKKHFGLTPVQYKNKEKYNS